MNRKRYNIYYIYSPPKNGVGRGAGLPPPLRHPYRIWFCRDRCRWRCKSVPSPWSSPVLLPAPDGWLCFSWRTFSLWWLALAVGARRIFCFSSWREILNVGLLLTKILKTKKLLKLLKDRNVPNGTVSPLLPSLKMLFCLL